MNRNRRRNDILHCYKHPKAILIEDYRAGDMVCPMCGLVVGDRLIDVGSEWRSFANDGSGNNDASRVGAAEDICTGSGDFSTMVAYDYSTTAYNSDGSVTYKNRPNQSSESRAMAREIKEIKQICDYLHLPQSIANRGNLVFKQVQETKLLKGRNLTVMAAACTYIGCRQEQVPRSLKEISSVTGLSPKEIARMFRMIARIVGTSSVARVAAADLTMRFCSTLDLSIKVQQLSYSIANNAELINVVTGRSPTSIAAAAIYMACLVNSIPKTPKEVGEACGVAEGTVRIILKIFLSKEREILPSGTELKMTVD